MMMKKKEILQSLLKLVVIVFAATVLGKIFTGLGFPETNIVVMYLLAVHSYVTIIFLRNPIIRLQ